MPDAEQPPLILSLKADDLDDRQLDGLTFFNQFRKGKSRLTPVDENQSIYWSQSDPDTAYTVTRKISNIRGIICAVYSCSCPDGKKYLRRDCSHQFAEKIRRGEVIISGRIPANRPIKDKAGRRPPRERVTASGRSIKTAQRDARVRMPEEIPRLILSLRDAYDIRHKDAIALRLGKLTADSLRCAVLLLKISEGKSADAMVSRYQELISDGRLNMRRPPHQNTLSEWINDDTITPVLEEMLAITTEPFRIREIGAIMDSSKVSQMRTAHARLVEYGTDKRPEAEWMKAHALVGVETLAVMAVEFSAKDIHDINHFKSLLAKVPKAFALRFLLADRAYLSENTLGTLWDLGIRAVIPVKSKWDPETKKAYYEAAKSLANWYDNRPREFDEIYRLRPKIEGLFSLMKRLADGFCWSRGRPRTGNQQPTAWKNEVLCKFIYLNLRATVTLSEETGYRDIDYRDHGRFFPAPANPLLIGPA